MTKVAVLGSSGFLGKQVSSIFLKKGFDVLEINRNICDLTNREKLLLLLNKEQPEIIINCAAVIDFKNKTSKNTQAINVSLVGTLTSFSKLNNCHFLHMSSIAVYGTKSQKISINSQCNADTNYGKSKLAADEIIIKSNCKYTILRFSGIYGENGANHLALNRVISQAKQGIVPSIHGKGTAKRNYIYVKDAARAVFYAVQEKLLGTHLIAGSETLTFAQMLQTVCNIYLQARQAIFISGKCDSYDQIVTASNSFPMTNNMAQALQKKLKKIAILADIHANYPALKAVLKAVDKAGIHRIYIAGDLIDYYYDAAKVLQLLSPYHVTYVRGNHEDALKAYRANDVENVHQYGSGLKIACQYLTEDQLSWLENMPHPLTFSEFNKTVLLSHGTPWRIDQYVYPDCEDKIKSKLFSYQANLIVMGHTHYPIVWRRGDQIIVNPGSVGQQRDGLLGACWAVWDVNDHSVELKREPYDVSEVIKQVETFDPDNLYLKKVLTRQKGHVK
jgi:putative phosphoesterase